MKETSVEEAFFTELQVFDSSTLFEPAEIEEMVAGWHPTISIGDPERVEPIRCPFRNMVFLSMLDGPHAERNIEAYLTALE